MVIDARCTKRDILHEIFVPKSIITWIFTYITKPITGFEHKTNWKGEYLNFNEQLSETHYQLMIIATDYFKRGASERKILSVLSSFQRRNC